MAYKSNQSYAETDYDKWLKMEQAEQQKTNTAGVQGFNSAQDALNYANSGATYKTSGVAGDGSRVVAPGTSGADEFWLSDGGYDIVQNAKAMYEQAGTQQERDYGHKVAEQARARAGYSGGTDGSMYLAAAPQNYTLLYGLDNIDQSGEDYAPGSVFGMNGGTGSGYKSGYQSEIDAALNALLNREGFSYDKESDPLYQMYKDSYTRAGERAMKDTLAQISARTGGLASSYAGTASQQSYNNYMAMLADKVPELYDMRYNQYLDELEQQRTDLDTLLGIDDMYYDRYRDTVGDQQWQQQFDYGVSRDAVSDSQYAQALAQQQVDSILAAGGTPSAELLAQAGYSTEYAGAMGNYYRREAMSGGGGGGEEIGGYVSVFDMMKAAGVPADQAYAYLIANKYSDKEAEKIAATYASLFDDDNGDPGILGEHGSSGNLISVPGFGEISYEDAEALDKDGYIELMGVDKNGKPVYRRTGKKIDNGMQMSR